MQETRRAFERSLGQALLVLLFLAGLSQPAWAEVPAASATLRNPLQSELQRRFGEIWVKTELYFGLSHKEGGFISEDQWRNFADQEISPALEKGFTILGGEGQYMLRGSPIVIKEQAKVLVVVHPMDERFDKALDQIIEAYRRRFSQESVLKVTSFVRAKF